MRPSEHGKVKVVVSQKLQLQVQWLCQQIEKYEWSGCLFYHVVEGELGTDHCVISADFLHLMDIGSEVYTEYEYGSDFIRLMMENPELRTAKKGHLHSH